ncbi:hypothetical protein Tco_1205998, partial [Tanacetum coccineum]
MHITHDTEEPASMPYDSPLQSVHSLERDEGSMQQNELTNLVTKLTDRVAVLENDLQQTKKLYSFDLTKLILRVKKLENTVKTSKGRRRARLVLSEDEDVVEDSSKQRRKISKIDRDPTISLVQDEGMTWFQKDAEIQEKNMVKKGKREVSTAGAKLSTVIPKVSTATENLVYIRRSAEKRKDKGKAVMKEDESIDEEERKRFTRDAEIAKQLQEEIDIARQEQEKYDLEKALKLQKQIDERKEVVAETDTAHEIDWNDPAMIRFHVHQNRPFFVAEVRKNMCMYLKNQGGYKQSHFKGMWFEE